MRRKPPRLKTQKRNMARKMMTLATPLSPSSWVNMVPWSSVCRYAMGRSEMFGNMPPARIPPLHCLGTGSVRRIMYARPSPVPKMRAEVRQMIPTILISLSSMLATILLKDRQGSSTVRTISEMLRVASAVRMPILHSPKPTPMIR